MAQIGIGIVGGGYMGKAHSVAMAAVGPVFDTALRPTLEMICTTTEAGAADNRVIAFVAAEIVAAGAFDDRIVALAAEDLIISEPPEQDITAERPRKVHRLR